MRKADATVRTNGTEPRLSRASVGRLSLYLRRLEALRRDGVPTVSSALLGEALSITDAQVRKDLAPLSTAGHPGIGYAVDELICAIRKLLGIDREWPAALVGVGNLARALLRYPGFVQRGFQFVALFDIDSTKVGQRIEKLLVHPLDQMSEVIAATGVELGVVTVPAEAAQAVADALVAGGVRGLLNFSPGVVRVPAHIHVVSVDLTVQFEQLAFLVQGGR